MKNTGGVEMEEIKKAIWDEVLSLKDEIEDGWLCLESGCMTVEEFEDALSDVKKALDRARIIDAYITPAIDGRDNGSWTDGNKEIVAADEIYFEEDLPDDEGERARIVWEHYMFSKDEVTPTSALYIDLSANGFAYDLAKEVLDRIGVDYCGVSVSEEIYIPIEEVGS